MATVLLSACAGDGDGLDENGRPAGDAEQPLLPQFASIQSQVFTPICTACHAGAGAPLGLRLDEGAAFAMLVNAPSTEVPTLRRVEPGNPGASYLIQKLEGTAAVGGRMPLNAPPLPAQTIQVIRQWIADGAQPSAVALSAAEKATATRIDAIWPMADAVLGEAPREIVISSNAELDMSLLNAATVTLRRAGDANRSAHPSGREIVATISVRSLQPTVLAVTAASENWEAGRYELRVSAGPPLAVADRAARVIDGDGDGEPGGDFVLRFELENAK
ncbi:MAG: hypothetical protein ACREXP_08555 [Steroidobacteraceae bacterium]